MVGVSFALFPTSFSEGEARIWISKYLFRQMLTQYHEMSLGDLLLLVVSLVAI